MADGGEVVGDVAEGSGELAKVDGEGLVLGQDVREEGLTLELALGDPEGHSLVSAIDGVTDLDGIRREVLGEENGCTDKRFYAR